MFTAEELLPIKLTLELALITTVFLLLVATPLAWWLSHTKSKWRAPISAIGSSAERARFLSPRCHGTVGSFRQAH